MVFKNKEYKKLPLREDVLSVVSDAEIFSFYLGNQLPKKLISSPLRNDKIPSFGLFKSTRYGIMMYKDFATGETGDCFVFVKRLFNLEKLTDAYNKIASDFNMDQFEIERTESTGSAKKNNILKLKNPIEYKEKVKISVIVRKFTNEDKAYWFDKYGINISLLVRSKVYPISHYFLNNYSVKTTGLAYAFVENKDEVQTFKIYQPFGENKWINNNDFSTWELWSQLPEKGDTLIITSSRKDAMVINSMFDPEEICSCSLQGENLLPKESVMEELSKRFKKIFVLYDNDKGKTKNWGRIAGEKICSKYSYLNITQIEIDDSFDKKDISDFREFYGKEKTFNLIKNLINV